MSQILTDIFKSKQVVDEDGKTHELHSNTNKEQCDFLQTLVREIAPTSCIEIGLAYGISTLAILESLTNTAKPFTYVVMDPFQKEHWNNIGLANIKRAGLWEKVSFLQKFSDQALPDLYNKEHRIQFAYIDTTKVFDVLMVDIYYLAKMLDKGGVIVLDDCGFPGIRILVRFLSQHPSFKIYRGFARDNESLKMRLLRRFSNAVIKLAPFKKRVLGNYNFATDRTLGVDFDCIAFQKVKDDERTWNWFAPF